MYSSKLLFTGREGQAISVCLSVSPAFAKTKWNRPAKSLHPVLCVGPRQCSMRWNVKRGHKCDRCTYCHERLLSHTAMHIHSATLCDCLQNIGNVLNIRSVYLECVSLSPFAAVFLKKELGCSAYLCCFSCLLYN